MRRDEPKDYAGFGVRLFAWLTDMAVLAVPLTGLRAAQWFLRLTDPAGFLVRSVFFRFSLLDIAAWAAAALYFTLTTYCWGGTPGKHLLRLRVVSAEDRPLTLWETVMREVIGRYLSGAVFMLGYLGILLDGQKRALHDLIADTRVVYVLKRTAPKPAGQNAGPGGGDSLPAAVPEEAGPSEPHPVFRPAEPEAGDGRPNPYTNLL